MGFLVTSLRRIGFRIVLIFSTIAQWVEAFWYRADWNCGLRMDIHYKRVRSEYHR